MSRELDKRDFSANAATATRTLHFDELARQTSDALAGDHRISISGFDSVTGNPSGLVSEDAPASNGNYIQRAIDHLQQIAPAMGFAATQPKEFVAAPQAQKTSSGAVAVHLQQYYKGISIFQAAQTVSFLPTGELTQTLGITVTVPSELDVIPDITLGAAVQVSAEFVSSPTANGETDQFGEALAVLPIDLTDWIPKVIAVFSERADSPAVVDGGPFNAPIKVFLIWFPLADTLRLAWHCVISLPAYAGQYRVIVDSTTREILYCHQLVQSVTTLGNVYKQDGASPRTKLEFPAPLSEYKVGSIDLPSGFPDPWVATDSTEGNAVAAHLEDAGPPVKATLHANTLQFDPVDPFGDEQKVVNLFYYTCWMHDYFYLLGFRELSGNFQKDNFGRQGLAADALDARAYMGAVWATASMSTPVDGSSPTMKMGLVPATGRHTAFDATVVFHEYTHGVTSRLVGGALNSQSLDGAQCAGMSEGWSDYVACTITERTTVGSWVTNDPAGVRQFRYDSAFPDGFGALGTGRYTEPHNIGEIWCAALVQMNAAIGAAIGIQLVVDGLKLLPANPNFLAGRDSILTALSHRLVAAQLTNSEFVRLSAAIWQVFARFGMGPNAKSNGFSLSGVVADFTTPQSAADSGVAQPRWSPFVVVGNETDRLPPGTPISAAANGTGAVDIFAVASDGGVYTASSDGGSTHWSEWSRVGSESDKMPLRSTVTALSVEGEAVELFVVAGDGGIYTSSRDGAAAAWSEWSRVGVESDRVPLGSTITAISAEGGGIELFVVAGNGGVFTSSRGKGSALWSDWSQVASRAVVVPVLSVVAAASLAAGTIELAVVASDGGVYTSSRSGATASWTAWARVGAGGEAVPSRSVVSAVSAEGITVDLFVVASDGGIYTSSSSGVPPSWTEWSRIGTASDEVPLGSTVSAICTKSGATELLVVHSDGSIYSSSRTKVLASWSTWSKVGTASDAVPLRSAVSVTQRTADALALFVLRADQRVYSAVATE